MATTKRGILFGVTVLSFLTFALLITSFVTQSWVEAMLFENASDTLKSPLNYGLFRGALRRANTEENNNFLSLTLTCLMGENICAWSCQQEAEQREDELWSLYRSGTLGLNISTMIRNCEASSATRMNSPTNHGQGKTRIQNTDTETAPPDLRFINAGLWVSTLLFLALSVTFAFLTSVFSLRNVVSNPVHQLEGVRGLYIWNALAALSNLMVLILWGTQFATTLTDNVTYSEVISGGFVSKGTANLGYSYWLVLLCMLAHTVNLLLLTLRDFLINGEPESEEPIKMEEDQDGAMFMY